ncbi:MAG TPA: single-stranded DNA-binding protein [Oculatellaceae cyanobacterium]
MANKIDLTGFFVRDPEMRYFESGKALTTFTLMWKDKKDDEQYQFIECKAWNKVAEQIGEEFKKSSFVDVHGKITQESWTQKDGRGNEIKRSKIVIIVFGIGPHSDEKKEPAKKPTGKAPKNEDLDAIFSNDDEIPF